MTAAQSAGRDHCPQYMMAVPLIFGGLTCWPTDRRGATKKGPR
jgi:2-methylcitrate dehydratase PrpD